MRSYHQSDSALLPYGGPESGSLVDGAGELNGVRQPARGVARVCVMGVARVVYRYAVGARYRHVQR